MSFIATSTRSTQESRERFALPVLGVPLAAIGPWIGQAALPFALIVYLGMRDGGYDDIVRGEVGIAAWWILLAGAAVGVLPAQRLNRASWAGLGVLFAFAAWTGLGIGWSESAERSVAEFARVAALLGVLALAIAVQTPGALRRVVCGVACGIAVIGLIALLSRFKPDWFPALEIPNLVDGTEARLHYPLNYWNGLAAFMAMGIPLLLAASTYFRHLAARAICVAVVPALALTAYFTLSRGGVLEIGIALAVLLALHPRRVELLASACVAGLGGAILIAAAAQRSELTDGLETPTALSQGSEMLAMTLVICVGAGMITVALGLWTRYSSTSLSAPRPSKTVVAAGVAALIAVLLVAGVPGAVSDGWETFKEPEVPSAEASRFDAAGGSGRYQWWSAAVDASATDPLKGIGPGTFEFWWARESSIPAFVRDAHSLYFETLGELGIVGLVLVVGLIAIPFVAGLRRLRAVTTDERVLLAGAIAACAAFAVAAAIEWVWELTVLPVTFLLLTAAIVGLRREPGEPDVSPRPGWKIRATVIVVALGGLVAIAIPMAGAQAIRDSQAGVRSQDLSTALEEANSAASIQPYAASASLQQALVFELQGDYESAIAAARAATTEEPTNWRTWLVLSRLEAQVGNVDASVEAYREARDLNPNSPLFQ